MANAKQLIGGVIFSGPMLLQPLILALTYTWSQENPNANVTIFVLTFPAKYLPYVMLFITAVSGGIQGVYVQLSGLLAAHLFDFLTRIWPTFGGGRNMVPTPQFVKRWFTPANARVQQRGYGTAVHPAGPSTAGGAAAAAREGWTDTRGPGRRLGGD
jgi:Derlin-2/3